MIIDFNAHIQKIKDVRSVNIKEGLSLGIPEMDEEFR